jgi:hypothetical protein
MMSINSMYFMDQNNTEVYFIIGFSWIWVWVVRLVMSFSECVYPRNRRRRFVRIFQRQIGCLEKAIAYSFRRYRGDLV